MTQDQLTHIRALVAALRTGAWPQTFNRLVKVVVRGTEEQVIGYCCLGVACEQAVAAGFARRQGSAYFVADDSGTPSKFSLPWQVASQFYGFTDHDPSIKVVCRETPTTKRHFWCEDCQGGTRNEICDNLVSTPATRANDDFMLSFPQIADAFERTYLREDHQARLEATFA